jgi:hypothetical protein
MLVLRQPNRSIRAAASGGRTSMPHPVPAAATPSAALRRRANHPPRTASVGT